MMPRYLSQVVQVHFCTGSGATERLACVPGMEELHWTVHHPHYQRTNDWRAVTCQSCKESSVYKQSAGAE